MSARRPAVTTVVAALLLALVAGTAAEAAKAPSPRTQVNRAFTQLINQTRKLPKGAVSKRNRAKLLRTAKRARKLSKRQPCKAIKTLRAYKRQLRRVRVRKFKGRRPSNGSARGRLQARLVTLNAALLQLPKAGRCGGGNRARVTETKTTVL